MNQINTYYRPIIISAGHPRALQDREIDTVANDALDEALKGEKAGTEGYVLEIKKVEEAKE